MRERVYFVDHDIESVFSTPYRPRQPVDVANAAIQAIDHTSNIVKPANLDHWADFYKDTFAFVQKQYLDVKGRQTGMRARSMVSPCGKVSIPIAAAAHDQPGVLNQNDEFIRDYRGEGIQHIAFLSSNIEQTIAAMEKAGIDFMDTPPKTYYYLSTEVMTVWVGCRTGKQLWSTSSSMLRAMPACRRSSPSRSRLSTM